MDLVHESEEDDDFDNDDLGDDSSVEEQPKKRQKGSPSPGVQLTLKTCFQSGGGDLRSLYSLLSDQEIEGGIAKLRANPPKGYTPCDWPVNWMKKPNAATKLGTLMTHTQHGYAWFCCATRQCMANSEKVRLFHSIPCYTISL